MSSTDTVQWPGKPIDADGDDLQAPAVRLLEGLKLITKPDPHASSADVIESTVLELTKQVRNLIAAAGGATALIGALGSGWAAVADNTPLAIALVIGVAIVVAASVIGLARVMDGDVRGRSAVTTQQLRARSDVAVAFIEQASAETKTGRPAHATPAHSSVGDQRKDARPSLANELRHAVAAYGDRVEVETSDGWSFVRGMSWKSDESRLHLGSGDIAALSEVSSFRVQPATAGQRT